eukprot:m.25102 g.25102  ORF g.25102 m.25102 type:complete len:393 (+) comp28737_c0_seq2:18-1196(+)
MDHCSFFVTRKRRFCKLSVREGSSYCGEHLNWAESEESGEGERKRIPCPYDPKHSVYATQLEKHKKVCNSRPKPKPLCYVESVNAGIKDYIPSEEEKFLLRNFPSERIRLLIEKIKAIEIDPIKTAVLSHPSMEEEIKNAKECPNARKHLEQQSSLIAHLDSFNLLHPAGLFVEFGAGKGKLSHWVERALKNSSQSRFLLIDRQNCRNKMDVYHRSGGPEFHRVLMDIEHLCLGRVEAFRATHAPVIGLAKHLCGSATDLALRCLTTTLGDNSKPGSFQLRGLGVALCCHHKCTWPEYVGREAFIDWGLDAVDFHAMTLLSSWATCARPETDSPDKERSVNTKALGRKCKDLLNVGRQEYLKKCGMTAKLVHFVEEGVTLENTALVGRTASI